MLKASHCISLLVVLWMGVVIYAEECKYSDRTWGDDNPLIYYYCDLVSNQSIAVECPPGSGYVNNGRIVGCIAWDQWDLNCIEHTPLTAESCGQANYLQPHGYLDPSYFYLCIAEDMMPVPVKCPIGQGFNAGADYKGCFPWATWRNITGCLS